MRIEELERELRATRPEPHMDFARRLDEWAEAGFPKDRGLGPGLAARGGALRRLWDRVSSTPPRRLLLPAGAVATAVVVAGVVVGTAGQISGGSDETALTVPSAAKSGAKSPHAGLSEGGAGGGAAAGAEGAAPSQGSAGQEYNLALPDEARAVQKPVVPTAGADAAGVARGTEERIVDATARLSLGAGADEVQDVANGVVEVTDRYGGVVQSSQVSSDQAGARAAFELEIPYKQLDAALADLSGLADVISRTEGGEDITARAVRARKQLARTLDQLREQRVALIKADTREEKLVIQSRIDSLQATADAQQAALNGVKRQGRFATVDVDVTSNGPAADDGRWNLGDALDDAGRVLEVIGGVALISLAILLPLALVVSLVALILIRARGRARDKALDT